MSLWIEKYRPTSLDNVISHGAIIQTIKKFIESGELPHLLLYGGAGTGKTSTILALVKSIYGDHYKHMMLELNASDNRNIKVVRDIIKEYASTKNMFVKGYKIIILDEADSMTDKAQFCLRRIMETYTENVRFCLICNYINKIIPALQSRCLCFNFYPIGGELIKNRLNEILDEEEIGVDEESLDIIVDKSGGDMRKCLNILQSATIIHGQEKEIDKGQLCKILGYSSSGDVENIIGKLMNVKNIRKTIEEICGILTENDLQIEYVLIELHKYLIQEGHGRLGFLLQKIADVEEDLSNGTSVEICVGVLVSAFY